MFSPSKKEPAPKRSSVAPSANSNSLNSLVQGTVIEGTVNAQNDIRIDGKLTGNLICSGKVIIGPQGFIEGDIKCDNAVIEGRFDGVLTVSELLNVKETATINGEITTNKLIVQSGAIFNVACRMGGQTLKEFTKPKSKSDKEIVSFLKE